MTRENLKERIKTIDRKIIYGASALAVVTVLGLGTLTFGKAAESHPKRAEEPLAVTAMTAAPTTIDAGISAAGALASKNSSVLSSKIMGKVVELTVAEGDYVSPGRLLMKVESGEISAQLYQAQAAYNNAKLQYDRIKSLFDQNAATQMEMDQATLGFESAKAGLNGAKAMESYTITTAPIAGRIVEKRINLGEMALPGQPILKIEDNRNLRLEVTVKEEDIRAIQPGHPVAVRIDALPGREIRAKVAQIVPASDVRTHSFVVKIDIPAEKDLITGMYGKAFFSTGRREAILIPRSAVVNLSGLSGVYIVSPEGNAAFQMVQLGETRGDLVEAVTGLEAGDRVIVSKQTAGIDGRKVVVASK